MANDCQILRVDPEGVGPAARLVSIFDPSSVGEALAENGWTNSEAIEILTEVARDRANATSRERMAAIKMIEDKGEKALTLAGVIQRISLEALKDEGGTKKKLTADGLRLLKEGTARTLSTIELLEAGLQTPELIEVDPEESHDARTESNVPTPSHSGTGGERPRPNDPSGSGGSGNRRSEPGPCTDGAIHGLERTNPPYPTGQGQDDDNGTIQGAGDERERRTSIQPGRSQQSSNPGAEDQKCGREAGRDLVSHPPDPNVGNAPGLERPSYTDPSSKPPSQLHRPHTTARRTTPYTPGEARRRAGKKADPSIPDAGPDTPEITSPRPADGENDRPGVQPRIAARYLPPALAAAGFPGDATPTD